MLIVEDGTGVGNANSYADATFADAYFTNRAISTWATLAPELKDGLLVRATETINLLYQFYWVGEQEFVTQSLPWPRLVNDAHLYPVGIQNATAALALFLNSASVFTVPTPEKNGLMAQVTEKTVGPMSIKTEFKKDGFGSRPSLIVPPDIFAYLLPFISAPDSGRVYK